LCSALALQFVVTHQLSVTNEYYYYYYYYIDGLFSRTTWASRHQKGKPFWILLEQEMIGWQWHQLDHMQFVCTSLQTDNHASTSPLKVFTGWMPFLPLNQQHQSTEGRQLPMNTQSESMPYSCLQQTTNSV